MITQFHCSHCQIIFERNDVYIRHRKQINVFCTQECKNLFYKNVKRKIRQAQEKTIVCTFCQKTKIVQGNQLKPSKSGHRFCSLSCANKYFGQKRAKPKKPRKLRGFQLIKNWTIKEYCGVHKGANRYNQIRQLSRTIMKGFKVCKACNYDKHVEICHIKPISEFDENTKIEVVNAKENLVALCPNCHWELDHGLLKLE